MAVSARRNAKVELTADAKGVTRGVNDARRTMRGWEREQASASRKAARDADRQDKERRRALEHVGKQVRGAGDRGSSFLAGAAGGIAAIAGADVAGGIGSAVTDVLDFERSLVRLQVASRKTPEEIAVVRQAIGSVSTETVLGRAEVLGFGQAFVDLAGASALTPQALEVGAKVMRATGTSAQDAATMMYSLGDALHIDASQMESTLSGLNNLSKDGAIHFNQMAGEIVALAPKFARFGVTGRAGAIELGAMFQVVRSGFKSADEASTGMQGIFRGLSLHADKFEKSGVHIFNVAKDGTKTFKPLSEIFEQIDHSKLAKDPTLLQKAFGRGEAESAYRLLTTHRELLATLEKEGDDTKSLAADMATVNDSATGKIEASWNAVKLAIANVLTPDRINAFADKLQSIAGFIAKAVGALDHLLGHDSPEVKAGMGMHELMAGIDPTLQVAVAKRITQSAQGLDRKNPIDLQALQVIASVGQEGAQNAALRVIDAAGLEQDKYGLGWHAKEGASLSAMGGARNVMETATEGGDADAALDAARTLGRNTAGYEAARANRELALSAASMAALGKVIADALAANPPTVHMDGAKVSRAGADNPRAVSGH